MKTNINLSVVIPTYKNKDLFLKNLKHNLPFLKGCEIIVVNDYPKVSLKKDLHKFKNNLGQLKKDVRLILLENKKNVGFGESVNNGVRKSKRELIMLLNNDVELLDDNYKKAINHLRKDKNLFAISFAQKEKNGSIIGKNRIYWYKGLFLHSKVKDLIYGINAWLEGGASIVDKKKFLNIGGFDSLYSPFYWEDVDLSYRVYKHGWKIIFDPSIVVIHNHQSTIFKYFDSNFTMKIAYRNQFIFIWKNVTEKKLILSHLLFLPYYLFYFLLKKEKEFLFGFLEALFLIKKIIWKRNLYRDGRSDSSVLKLFILKQD
jgi:GT2 family glycosyltransferase